MGEPKNLEEQAIALVGRDIYEKLVKGSPQMNMFAIGMQLKVFVGLFLLAVCIMFVPNIANYIMERMRDMIQTILGGL